MKSKPSQIKAVALGALLLVSAAGLMAWDFKDAGNDFFQGGKYQGVDTPPVKKEKKVRDLDDAMSELDRGLIELEKSLKEVNWEKVRKEIEESVSKLDADKIRFEIDKALKEVDMGKIKAEIESSLAGLNMEKIRLETEKALKEVDMEKIRAEVKESLREAEQETMKAKVEMKELEKEMKMMTKELEKIGPEIKKSLESLEGARVEMEKAKEELKAWKSFVDDLEQDGLISKKKGYTLEHKEGELFINGTKQPAAVYNKYRSFLEKHKQFNLKSDKDNFMIDMD